MAAPLRTVLSSRLLFAVSKVMKQAPRARNQLRVCSTGNTHDDGDGAPHPIKPDVSSETDVNSHLSDNEGKSDKLSGIEKTFDMFARVQKESESIDSVDVKKSSEESSSHLSDNEGKSDKPGGIEKPFNMFARVQKEWERIRIDSVDPKISKEINSNQDNSFATMLRNSKLIQLGDPAGKVTVGEIFDTVGEDLYIDFGGKFHCVCRRPRVRFGEKSNYEVGKKVDIRLLDLELSSRFEGAERDITLLEADAVLIGLHVDHNLPERGA